MLKLKRVFNTWEIANLLCSLCSDEYDALSGSILKVFGKKEYTLRN